MCKFSFDVPGKMLDFDMIEVSTDFSETIEKEASEKQRVNAISVKENTY